MNKWKIQGSKLNIIYSLIIITFFFECNLTKGPEGNPFRFYIINETDVELIVNYSTMDFSDSLISLRAFTWNYIYHKRYKIEEKKYPGCMTDLMKSLYVYRSDSLIYYQDPCEVEEWDYRSEWQDWEEGYNYYIYLDSLKLGIN